MGLIPRRWLGALAALAVACAEPILAARSAEPPEPLRVFAWVIRGPGVPPGARPDYLLGTAHIAVRAGAEPSAELRSTLAGCSRFMLEADLGTVTPELVSRYILLDPGERLDDLVSAEDWGRLTAALIPLGLPPDAVRAMEPWYLSMLLTLPQVSPERLVDAVLAASARSLGAQIGYLETAHEVLAAMDAVDGREEVAMLVETLADLEGQRAQMRDVEQAYWRGELETIGNMLLDPDRMARYPDFFERLLFARNRRWLPAIVAALQDEDAVIAVGLGHVIGPDGLVEALRARDYTVEATRL